MTEITQKKIKDLKQTYKKKYHQDLNDKKAYDIIDGANRYA